MCHFYKYCWLNLFDNMVTKPQLYSDFITNIHWVNKFQFALHDIRAVIKFYILAIIKNVVCY
jgi:hypothetical protein